MKTLLIVAVIAALAWQAMAVPPVTTIIKAHNAQIEEVCR
jgi:hypothetical protein